MLTNISARNLHDLAPQMLGAINKHGVKQSSRNGTVTRLPGLTSIEIRNPLQNVCFFRSRDANPFFHLIEAMAMLVPVNSNELLSFFASNMSSFSDDGKTYNAFYGSRARTTWGDQLGTVVEILRKEPQTRRAVVNLWDPRDLTKETKDMACNLCMIFSIDDGELNMTTFNRSNDAIWGFMTGANMVHFPFFQEYVACALGIGVGRWYHSSANMHIYDWNEKFERLCDEIKAGDFVDPYVSADVLHAPLFPKGEKGRKVFQIEIESMILQMLRCIRKFSVGGTPDPLDNRLRITPFLRHTVVPMFNAYLTYKVGRRLNSLETAIQSYVHTHLCCMNPRSDWRSAATRWFEKRIKA